MKTLIILSHSSFESSVVNKALAEAAGSVKNVTIRHLERMYGHDAEKINVEEEQAALLAADKIIFQFPVYWFNMPPMLKAYMDRVFLHGWAYGTGGDKVKGKILQAAVSTGAPKEAYDNPSVSDVFLMLSASAGYMGMKYAEPFATYGCQGMFSEQLAENVKSYVAMLQG